MICALLASEWAIYCSGCSMSTSELGLSNDCLPGCLVWPGFSYDLNATVARERESLFFKRLSAGVDDKIIKIDLRVRLFGFSSSSSRIGDKILQQPTRRVKLSLSPSSLSGRILNSTGAPQSRSQTEPCFYVYVAQITNHR